MNNTTRHLQIGLGIWLMNFHIPRIALALVIALVVVTWLQITQGAVLALRDPQEIRHAAGQPYNGETAPFSNGYVLENTEPQPDVWGRLDRPALKELRETKVKQETQAQRDQQAPGKPQAQQALMERRDRQA